MAKLEQFLAAEKKMILSDKEQENITGALEMDNTGRSRAQASVYARRNSGLDDKNEISVSAVGARKSRMPPKTDSRLSNVGTVAVTANKNGL